MWTEPQKYPPALPPAVMVHGLAQAKRALRTQRPMTLLSSSGAAGAWGCLWWQNLLDAAGHAGPALLDCGASPGRAVEALELGVWGVVLSPCPVWAEIAALAEHKQAVLLPAPPIALDMAQKHDENRLIAWLGG